LLFASRSSLLPNGADGQRVVGACFSNVAGGSSEAATVELLQYVITVVMVMMMVMACR